jgi:uncharacterized protein (DUF427 family)
MPDYPSMIVPVNHVEPVPRRVRGVLDGVTVVDTVRALYVWEWPAFPQYYLPRADVREGVLIDEGLVQHSPRGELAIHGLRVGDQERPAAARVLNRASVDGLDDTVWFEWGALDAWFEEDEQVFVHPRSPYARVDALRSTRTVRVELEGTVLAETGSPVMVFETGLPTRYYINRTEVDFTHLVASSTVTECPYKGTTSGYWSVDTGGKVHADLAWTYAFPARSVESIAGLIAFYNEKLDIFVDGRLEERPKTPFS